MRILIVEDDPGIVLVYEKKLALLLKAFPDAVKTFATTLAEARRIAAEVPYQDVIVLDLTLPGTDWEETVAAVPELSMNSALFIVTGQPEEKVRAMLSNPDIEVLHKTPELFFGNSFLEAIARVLNRRTEKSTARIYGNLQAMKEYIAEAAAADATTPPSP